jgi:hypothetical protein
MTARMRTLALVAVALVLAGTAVWTDAWALEDRSPAHDQRSAAVDTLPAAVVATVADARPSASLLPLLPLGIAFALALASLAHRAPTLARATYPASRRLVHAGRRAPPRAPAHVGLTI